MSRHTSQTLVEHKEIKASPSLSVKDDIDDTFLKEKTPHIHYNPQDRLFLKEVCENIVSKKGDSTKDREIAIILVNFIIPSIFYILDALESKIGRIAAIIPKSEQKDYDEKVYSALQDKHYTILQTNKTIKENEAIDIIKKAQIKDNEYYIIMDIGGRFANCLPMLQFEKRLLGVVEDTENGHQEYKKLIDKITCPIYSVARSPLKSYEDRLVGESIINDAAAILPQAGRLLFDPTCNMKFGVIGYGKIGQSATAQLLYRGGVKAYVYDIRPDIYNLYPYLEKVEKNFLLQQCDAIFCCTGNGSIKPEEYHLLKDNVYIISCTSADKEFGEEFVKEKKGLTKKIVGHTKDIFKYSVNNNNRTINFLCDGNAVNNFSCRTNPYAILTISGLVASAIKLSSHSPKYNEDKSKENEIKELSVEIRNKIIDIYDKHFPKDRYRRFDKLHDMLYATYQRELPIKLLLYDNIYFDINDIYINLAIIDEKNQKEKEKNALSSSDDKGGTDGYKSDFSFLNTYKEIFDEKESLTLDQLFEAKSGVTQKILVTGRAGIGKSTFCRYILYQWMKKISCLQKYQWVFWIPLRNLANNSRYTHDKKYTFVDILRIEFFGNYTGKHLDDDLNDLYMMLCQQKHQVLWLLDGYDEIYPLENHLNHSLIGIIDELLNHWQVLVTSRSYTIPSFDRHVEIIGFSSSDIETYIDKFFRAINKDKKENEATREAKACSLSLKQQIAEKTALLMTSRIPILLELICSISKNAQENIPTAYDDMLTMTSLYQKIVDQFLRRYLSQYHKTATRALSRKLVLTDDHCKPILEFLEYLAYHGLREPGIILNKIFVNRVFSRTCESLDDSIQRVLFNWILQSGFLKGTTSHDQYLENDYYFAHSTLQEYFASRYLLKSLQKNPECEDYKDATRFIRQNKYQHRHAQVFAFIVGLLSENDDTKESIKPLYHFWDCLEEEPRDASRIIHFQLVLRCLEESRCDPRIIQLEKYRNLLKNFLEKFYQDERNYSPRYDHRYLNTDMESLWNTVKTLLRQSTYIVRHIIIGDMIKGLSSNLKYRDFHLLTELGQVAATEQVVQQLHKNVLEMTQSLEIYPYSLMALTALKSTDTKYIEKMFIDFFEKIKDADLTRASNFTNRTDRIVNVILKITSVVDLEAKKNILAKIANIISACRNQSFNYIIFKNIRNLINQVENYTVDQDLFDFIRILNNSFQRKDRFIPMDESDDSTPDQTAKEFIKEVESLSKHIKPVDSTVRVHQNPLIESDDKKSAITMEEARETVIDYVGTFSNWYTIPESRCALSRNIIMKAIKIIKDDKDMPSILDISGKKVLGSLRFIRNRHGYHVNLFHAIEIICSIVNHLDHPKYDELSPWLYHIFVAIDIEKNFSKFDVDKQLLHYLIINTLKNIPVQFMVDYYNMSKDPLCIEAFSKLALLQNFAITIEKQESKENVTIVSGSGNIKLTMCMEHINKLKESLDKQAKECGLEECKAEDREEFLSTTNAESSFSTVRFFNPSAKRKCDESPPQDNPKSKNQKLSSFWS